MQTNPKIRLATSDPKLKDKIKIDLSGSIDAVYWYIRFNIPLDEASVNDNTMEVTDTEGYIMRTDISYQVKLNRIMISPLDSYEEQRYYLLKISKKVCSAKGQGLKTAISILFKLYQGSISEYKSLRGDVPVPSSKPRPGNYDELQKNRVPNDLDNYVVNRATHTPMKTESVGMNLMIGIIGMILAGVGIIMNEIYIIVGAVTICLGGVAHIYVQWRRRGFRSNIHYNKGVRFYNKMQYTAAKASFEKALEYDPTNELAKYGLVRVGLYGKETQNGKLKEDSHGSANKVRF